MSWALTGAGWCAGVWLLARVPAVPDRPTAPGPAGPLRVTVLVPARNEEGSLPHLLASLAAQTRPPDQLVVVDDHSTDRTGELARAAGATVVVPPELRPGWSGKCSALDAGVQVATGDLLIFLDADVRLGPDALRRLVEAQQHHGGLVSTQPGHDPVRPYEHLSAVCNVVALMGTGAFTGPPRTGRPVHMAFGPVLAIGVQDYRRIGGHAHPEVRNRMAEDIGLAIQAERAGMAVTVYAGGDQFRFRMYPDGPGQLVEGWTRSMVEGAAATPPVVAAAIGLWVTGALLGGGVGLASGAWSRRTAAGLYGVWAAQMAWLLGRAGRFGRLTPLTFPVPLVAFVALAVRSVVLGRLRRPVAWRGRVVSRG